MGNKWFEDHSEVVTFASVLADADMFGGAIKNVIYYFEKPWKWTDEYERWMDAGRPEGFGFAPAAE